MTLKHIIAILTASFLICVLTWLGALYLTGAQIDYRSDAGSGFIALRLAPEAGLSYQWSTTGQSVWFWRPDRNRRLWPVE
jgi:hypothetical protein